jgi:hypothetical protein
VSELVATFGLLAVIWGCVRRRAAAVPFAVGAYITAAYWFTASTSFATAGTPERNPGASFAGPGGARQGSPRSSRLRIGALHAKVEYHNSTRLRHT